MGIDVVEGDGGRAGWQQACQVLRQRQHAWAPVWCIPPLRVHSTPGPFRFGRAVLSGARVKHLRVFDARYDI